MQTLDGRWLSLDGRVLFKANVAASETYNTALEQHLREALGVRFAERPGSDPAKRPDPGDIRRRPPTEPALVDPPCPIEARRGELAIQSRMIMAGHRPRSKHCIWHDKRPGDPRGQTRTPIPDRATHNLAWRSRNTAGWGRGRRVEYVGGLEILITAVFMSADPQELYRQTSDPVRRQLNEVFFDRLYLDTDEVINDRAGGAIQ